MAMIGHKTESIYRRYSIVDQAMLEMGTSKLEALQQTQRRGRPVVALETSIVGQGLPAPHNLRAARDCESAIRREGAVPATVGVLDGQIVVGLTDAEVERIAGGATKVSSRDLGPMTPYTA